MPYLTVPTETINLMSNGRNLVFITDITLLSYNFSTELFASHRYVSKTDSLSPPMRMDVGKFNEGRAFIR